jgi:hypothetical protein
MPMPRVRFTARRMMVAIACFGLGLALVRTANQFISNTAYSERYNENRFNSIQPGMTSAEVLTVIGPPLFKTTYADLPGGDPDREDWGYSEQFDATRNYWRRQVVFKGGKVWYVVNEYWEA